MIGLYIFTLDKQTGTVIFNNVCNYSTMILRILVILQCFHVNCLISESWQRIDHMISRYIQLLCWWSVIYICPVMNIWSINRLLWRCDGDLNLICDLHLSCDEHLEYKQTLVWRCDGDLNLICDLHLSCDEHLEYKQTLVWRCDGELNLICDLHLSCDEHLEYKQTLVWRCDGDLNLICDLHLSCDEHLEYKETLVKMWWRSESDLWSTSVLWWTSGV